MGLQVVSVFDGDDVEILLDGEMDHSTVEDFRRVLVSALARLPRRVVVNMQDLVFLDSAGIGEIIRARRLLASRDRELVVRNANPSITRVLEMMGIHLIVRMESTQDPDPSKPSP